MATSSWIPGQCFLRILARTHSQIRLSLHRVSPGIPHSCCLLPPWLWMHKEVPALQLWKALEKALGSSLDSHDAGVHSCVKFPEQSFSYNENLFFPFWKPEVFTPASQDCMNNSACSLLYKSSMKKQSPSSLSALFSIPWTCQVYKQVIHCNTTNSAQGEKSVWAVTHFKEELTRVQFP